MKLTTVDDEVQKNIRRALCAAAVERAVVAVSSENDGIECVAVGKVVKVSKHHAVIAATRSNETPIPINAITNIKRLDTTKDTSADESTPSVATTEG